MVFLGFNTYPVLNVGRGFGFLPPQHWHGFAISAQIQVCYTVYAQNYAKAIRVTPSYGVVLFCFRVFGQPKRGGF